MLYCKYQYMKGGSPVKNIVLSISNGLMAEAIVMSLKKDGDFRINKLAFNSPARVVEACRVSDANVVLMEVNLQKDFTLENRLSTAKEIKKFTPKCNIQFICDGDAMPELGEQLVIAKQDGKIDGFFYNSVTSNYLTAMLNSVS